MNLTAISLLTLFGSSGLAGPVCREDDLSVQTSGGLVLGTRSESTPAVREFLGIPYAQPPVGELRFAPPLPAEPLGTVNATSLPPSCMQYLSSGAVLYTREVLEFNLQGLNVTGPVSEDCLSLSVWTPAAEQIPEGELLPVLLFIYGGGFGTGGMDVPYQVPAEWVQRTQAHVVVSFNYRLNIFGFPGAAGLEQQNLGLLDQRLAVEWVRDNIAAFGGDPDRIVLWGQSAGAMSVAYYNYAWVEDPIVKGLIHDSGTEFTGNYLGISAPEYSNFSFVAQNVGCGDLGPEEELACMRNVSAADIEDFVHAYSDAGTLPSITFAPKVDGTLVYENYTEQALSGAISKIPAIIGTNSEDGVPFAPYDPNSANETLANIALLNIFFCPSYKTSLIRLAAGVPTYRYEYFGNFSNISPKPWMGAYHSAELPMLFGTHPLYRSASSPLEYATSQALQDSWLAFARDGEEGLQATGWQQYTGDENAVVREFGRDVAVQDGDTQDLEAQCAQYGF